MPQARNQTSGISRLAIICIGLILSSALLSACASEQKRDSQPDSQPGFVTPPELRSFQEMCTSRTPDNWMKMKPMVGGKILEAEQECWGCMSDDGMTHFCSMQKYESSISRK